MAEDELEQLNAELRLLRERIEKNAEKIDRLSLDIRLIREQAERQEHELKPISEFLHDVQTVNRLGRAIRAVVGWVAILLGTGAIVWVAISGPHEK